MEKTKEYTSPYEMDGRIPWPKAIVYGLQHVLAMFVAAFNVFLDTFFCHFFCNFLSHLN